MQKRHLIPIFFAALLLLAPLANAKFSTSFTSEKFNTTSFSFTKTDKDYSEWQAVITNELTYNMTTTTGDAKIRLTNSSGVADRYFVVYLNSIKNVKVYWKANETANQEELILNTTLTNLDDPIYLTYKDSYLYVGNSTDYKSMLDGFAADNMTLSYVGAAGAADLTLSGYITVEVDDPPVTLDLGVTLDIIFAVLPLVFTVAVLGVVLKMFKEVSG